MAQLAISAAGAAIGFMVGGPMGAKIGWMIGSYIGGQVTAPDVEGPRLQDLSVQSSTYGMPIPVLYGTARLAGNVIWSTDLVEHATEEDAKGGPTVTSYSYTVSCAVALCEGEIAGVQKIWANNELIVDITPENTGDTGAGTYRYTVYTGSETQTADPRMQAELGAANTPAHRGMAYVVFEDFPLEKFGNRTPNFNFQVVASGTMALPAPTYLSTYDVNKPVYDSVSGTFVALVDGGASLAFFSVWDSTNLGTVTLPATCDRLVLGDRGTFWAVSQNGSAYIYNFSSRAILETVSKPSWRIHGAWSAHTSEMILAASNLSSDISVFNKSSGSWSYTTIATGSPTSRWGAILVIPSGIRAGWVVLHNGTNIAVLDDSYGLRLLYTCSPISSLYGSISYQIAYDTRRDLVYIQQYLDGQLYVVEMATLGVAVHIIDVSTAGYIAYHEQADIIVTVSPGSPVTYRTYDPDNLPTVLGSFTVSAPSGWPIEISGISDAVYVCTIDPTYYGIYKVPLFQRLTSTAAVLGDVVEDQCVRAGLVAADVDVTGLTASVRGYLVDRQASARANIEPLQVAYFFDAVESDDVLKFVARGGASAVTIPEADLGAHADTGSAPAIIEQTRAQETELPRIVWIDYLNPAAEYQQNSQYDRRLAGSANIETTLALKLVLTDDEAKQVAAANLYSAYANRVRYKFATTAEYIKYEPTDVVTLTRGNTLTAVRVVDKQEGGDGTIQWEAVAEDASVYTQSAAGVASAMTVQTVQTPVQTRLVLMDIPLLRDADEGAGFYYAACGYRTGWDGMQLYQSSDGGASWAAVATSANESTIGTVTTALGNWTGGYVVDEHSTVNVRLANSGLSLASVSLANLQNGSNAALVGDEVICFRDATLEADGSYTLTGLLRGLRGTQWAMSTHAAGDDFVLLSTSTTRRFASDSGEIGLARDYRGVSFYTTLSQAIEHGFTNAAVGLKPYAPMLLGGGRDASGNITAKWVRCTRIGGEWRDYVDATQPEASLAYEVDIYTDGTYTTVIRTITGITSETTSYTSAQQVTDFGGNQSTIYVKVYQVSATVGRGYALTGTI